MHKLIALFLVSFIVLTSSATPSHAQRRRANEFVDLSLLVDTNYPCTWPTGFPMFQIRPFKAIGPASIYNIDVLQIDGNTGTQIDVPPHSIPRPGTNLQWEGELGLEYTHKTEPFKFVGEACVIDITELLDTGEPGISPLILVAHVKKWEQDNRELGPGDVVLFKSGYSDLYYKPYPEGYHFIAGCLDKKFSGWPDPAPETMDYLGKKGVWHVGVDSPSIGPIPDLGEPVHYAGLKHGQIFTESATNLGSLPTTGAFYCCMGPRHTDGPYGEGRSFAIQPGKLATRLIESARAKRAIDLSVVLSSDLPVTWPGRETGSHRHPYLKVDFLYAANLDLYHHTHMMDPMAGTHLVTPSYSLPKKGFKNSSYSPEVQSWLRDYESLYGRRGFSDTTVEQIPLSQMAGNLRVIDVTGLVGSVPADTLPASPMIRPEHVSAFEAKHGGLAPGEVVVFKTGHIDRTFKAAPDDTGCMVDPLSGASEGWPAVSPGTIELLSRRGIRCVGIDAPTLGGVDARNEAFVNWRLASSGMVSVEFLHNLGAIPADTNPYFLFAPVRINHAHGSPGRAIVLY